MKTPQVVFFFGIALASRLVAQDIQTGLVGRYPLDGSGVDLSLESNALLLRNVLPATDRFGNLGCAVYLDGVASSMISNKDVPISGAQPRTIAVWVNADGFGSYVGNPIIVGLGTKTTLGTLFNLSLGAAGLGVQSWATASRALPFVHGNLVLGPDAMSNYWLTSQNPVPAVVSGEWVHLAVASGGSRSTTSFYINGTLVPILLGPGNSFDTFATARSRLRVSLGSLSDGSTSIDPTRGWWVQPFRGRLDDIRVYNRKLESAEVASVYAQSSIGNSAPFVLRAPQSQTLVAGEQLRLSVEAGGPPPLGFQWLRNGAPIVGAVSSSYTVDRAGSVNGGAYAVIINNSNGSLTSPVANVKINPSSALSNLSVRTSMQLGQTLIVGAVVADGGKSILLRAAGPALNDFGINGLSDPQLVIYAGQQAVASNDNWPSSLASTFSRVGAFAFKTGSLDAAVLQSVSGAFTVQARGGGSGSVLVEAYDTADGVVPRLVNLSARNLVGTEDNILIAGFAIRGTGAKQVLIRAIGPSLQAFGVNGALSDPRLEVFDGSGRTLAANDNWGSPVGSAAVVGSSLFSSVGAFPLASGSRDAALLITLSAGASYTVQVAGVGNTTGEALVEVYEVF